MMLRAVCVFSVMVLTAETLPFSNMDFRPVSVSRVDQKFNRLHSKFYLTPRLPARGSSRMFSGHPRPPIRHPALQYSDILNEGKKKISSFIPSRFRNPSSVFVDEYPGNIQLPTAQKVRPFGQRIRDKVQNFENQHGRRMQHVKEMLNRRFRLEKSENIRLKEAILKKKALLNKHQSFGWSSNYIGVPYHTMNDDHKIVKKPGANFTLYSQPNFGIPVLVPVSVIQPIATQYPVVPEVTTSVNFNQESEVPATIAGYVFPITSIATYKPDVIETTEITNSIDQDKMTISQLPSDTLNRYTHTTPSTTILTDPATESTILEANTIKTSFDEADGFTTEIKGTTLSLEIENEIFESVTIDHGAITEIGLRSTSLPSTDTTWQMESIEPTNAQTSLLIDLMSGNQVEPITSLVIDVQSTTMTEISPNFTATSTMSTDDKFASQIINTETTTAAIISTFPSTLPNHHQTTLGTEETSLQPAASETTTVTDEVFGIMNATFTSPAEDGESTSETILIFPSIISTETPMITDAISTTVDTAFDSSKMYRKMTTEIASTLPSTISIETTSWLPPTSGSTPLSDVLFGFGYNSFSNLTNEDDITTRVYATFPSTTQSETNTMVTEKLTTVNPVYDNSSIEMERTIEIATTLPSTLLTETTTTLEAISTVTHSAYTNFVNDGEITTKIVPSTISPETTSWLQPNSERTPLFDLLFGFGYNRFPSLTDEVETTSTVYATFPFTTQTEINTMVTEKLTVLNPVYDNLTIEMEGTIEITSTLPSTLSTETTTTLEEISTATHSAYTNAMNDDEITTEIVPSTISPGTTSWPAPALEVTTLLDVLSRFGYDRLPNSTDELETTTGIDTTFSSSIETERTTVMSERSTTVDTFSDDTTIQTERTTEVFLNLPSTILSETTTIFERTSTATDSHFHSPTIDEGIANDVGVTVYSEDPTTPTTTPVFKIATFLDGLPSLGYNYFTDSTNTPETTTRAYSTLQSTIPTETTTMLIERLMSVDLASDEPTVGMEITTEIVSTLPSTISTKTSTILDEISTTMDPGLAIIFTSDGDMSSESAATLPSTIFFETTSRPLPLEITPLVNVLSGFGYNRIPSSTDSVEKTTEIYSTSPLVITSEKTMTATENLTTIESAFDNSTTDTERTTEIVSMFPSTVSTNTGTSLEEIATTTSSKYPPIDEGTTVEIISTFSSIFPTEIPIIEHNYLTDSTIASEMTTRVDSKYFSTVPTETVAIVTEGWITSTSGLKNSTIEMDVRMDTDSNFPSISTETTTTLEEIARTTVSPNDSSTTSEEMSTKVIAEFSYVVPTETIPNLSEISGAVDVGKATTETVSMLSTTISTETTTSLTYESDVIAEQNFEYLEGNQVSSGVRIGRLLHENSDLVIPHVAYTAVEEPDEKSLLNLIPPVIEELRQDNVSPEEEYTLRQVFRDLWPLLKAESKRKQGELMDHKLAILLFEAGQRLSDTEGLTRDIAKDNLISKSKRDIGTNSFDNVSNLPKNTAQLLAIFPEIRAPARFEEVDDGEHKAQYDAPDYNSKHYLRHDDTERFSGYNNDQGPSIRELLQVGSRHKAMRQDLPNIESDYDYLY